MAIIAGTLQIRLAANGRLWRRRSYHRGTMKLYVDRIIDRQVGRNAQLFAQSLSQLEQAESRYPYLRILVSIIEQAHPEWNQAPEKDQHIAQLVQILSDNKLPADEVASVVRVRDEERGYYHD